MIGLLNVKYIIILAAVTSVGTQGSCTAGYAFASSSAIESSAYITTKQLNKYSVQQIIDCSKDYGNAGCSSGNALNSFSYIKEHGIAS